MYRAIFIIGKGKLKVMELIFLLHKYYNKLLPFLSDASLYAWKDCIPITDHPNIKDILLDKPYYSVKRIETNCRIVYGAIFNKFSIVKSPSYSKEVVILHGTNLHDSKVYLVLSATKNKFKYYLENISNDPCFYLQRHIISTGYTLGLSDKDIFNHFKSKTEFISDTISKRNHFIRFNFFNEEGKIVNSVYCSSELCNVNVKGKSFFKLK